MSPQQKPRPLTQEPGIPERSAKLFDWFFWYCRTFYLPGAFDAIRLSGPAPAADRPGPHVIALNHPAWWDPLIAFFATSFFQDMLPFAPMAQKGVDKYKFFGRMGIFGVDPETLAGARRFLQIGQKILSKDNHALWVTVQGEFADPRVRPVVPRSGVSHLLSSMKQGTFWTFAIEYPFWEEPSAQALIRFGEPVAIEPGIPQKAWNEIVARRLTVTMDQLAADACSRDRSRFSTLLEGKSRAAGMYDRLRRIGSVFSRKRFDPRRGLGQASSASSLPKP